MRIVMLKTCGEHTTRDVIMVTLGKAHPVSNQGFTPAQIRKHLRIMDDTEKAAEAGRDHVLLEEEHYALLKELIDRPVYAMATHDLMSIIDGILEAPSSPAVVAGTDKAG